MKSISCSLFNDSISAIMDNIENNDIEYRITRKNHKNLILLTEDNYNSMQETLYLLSSPVNAERLSRSIEQVKNGKFVEMDLE
jgi:antitoxin YefM